MRVLIVHAHHESASFSSSLARQATDTLESLGHTVVVSNLYSMNFNPVSDRRNFTSVKNADYLKQQAEDAFATEVNGFAPDVEAEIQKLESTDAIILSFPLWWFGMPAILKGWIDRVFAAGRVYGGSKLYENGIGNSRMRGMVLMTTGGGPQAYGGWGLNPSMETILQPIQHGVFWFNGILPLDPFIAWSAARISDEDRVQTLRSLDNRLRGLFDESWVTIPPMSDFPNWGVDVKHRFAVVIDRVKPPDATFVQLIPQEQATIALWKRQGKLLDFQMTDPKDANWRGFMTLRSSSREEVDNWLSSLPLASYLSFTVSELAKPNG